MFDFSSGIPSSISCRDYKKKNIKRSKLRKKERIGIGRSHGMDAHLESLLSQHGLQQAIEPLVKVGVDSHVALDYVDEEVIALMRRDHGLPFVTSKMLQDKMPVLLNLASNGTLRSVSRAQGRHISPTLPNASSITEAGCAKPLDSQSASILARGASDQAASIFGASAAVQSSCEQAASISGASAAEQSSCEQAVLISAQGAAVQPPCEQAVSILGASAAVQSSGELTASISGASAAVQSSGELAASILAQGAAVQSPLEQAASILGASAAVQSSGELAASISAQGAAVQPPCEQAASILAQGAAVQSPLEQAASILAASSALQSSCEQAASILGVSAAVQSSGEQAAPILAQNTLKPIENDGKQYMRAQSASSCAMHTASAGGKRGSDDQWKESVPEKRRRQSVLGKRPSPVPPVYSRDSKTANGAFLYPDGRINNRFQCPMCLGWYRFNNPQTFNANKARHMKNCKGQNNIPSGLAEGKRKSNTHKDTVAKARRVKRSAQVVQASKSKVFTGSRVSRGSDESNLMSVASSILEFSQKAHQSSVSDSSAAMDLPAHIEESDASFITDFYTTEQENENCESVARKFGLDAQKIFILNHKRYRGFKTGNTKLKAGTLLLLKGCHGDMEKTELDSKAKGRKR